MPPYRLFSYIIIAFKYNNTYRNVDIASNIEQCTTWHITLCVFDQYTASIGNFQSTLSSTTHYCHHQQAHNKTSYLDQHLFAWLYNQIAITIDIDIAFAHNLFRLNKAVHIQASKGQRNNAKHTRFTRRQCVGIVSEACCGLEIGHTLCDLCVFQHTTTIT
jgi:hypothetical protein